MTVTREPAGRAEADDELAALEAAAEQARGDARRAAQAVRLARKARGLQESPVPDAPPAATAASGTEVVSLTKRRVVDESEVAVVDDDDRAEVADDTGSEAGDTAAGDTADEDADSAAEDADSAAEDADSEDTDSGATRVRRRPRRVTVVAAVAAVLAAAFVVVAAVVHVRAGDDAATSPAAARDAALLAARQDIVVLNTLDYTDVEGGLQRWLGATTGTLRDQLSQVTAADKQAIAVSKSRTTASVLAAAVTQVDAGKGAATVLASVQIQVTPDGGQATTKRTRFSLTMQREGDTWKIGAVQQVGVTLS